MRCVISLGNQLLLLADQLDSLPSSIHRAMPQATHWVCCRCGFGPMIIDSCSSCLNCQHPGAKSPCCVQTSLSLHNPTSIIPSTSSYRRPSINDFTEPHTLPSVVMPIFNYNPSLRQRGTSLYLCCGCGDGPKVYEHHCRCIVCQHDACDACTYIK